MRQRLHKIIDEHNNAVEQRNNDDNNGEGPSTLPHAGEDEKFDIDECEERPYHIYTDDETDLFFQI